MNDDRFREKEMNQSRVQEIHWHLVRHPLSRTHALCELIALCSHAADLSGHGCEAIGRDGTDRFVEMARAHSGCEVLHQDFLALSLEPASLDGIFANASLFHVPTSELPRVLGELEQALRPGGVLFSSNPRGNNQEGWNGARYGAYHDLAAWSAYLADAGFTEIEHYYRPTGLPRSEQPWLASVWRKAADGP